MLAKILSCSLGLQRTVGTIDARKRREMSNREEALDSYADDNAGLKVLLNTGIDDKSDLEVLHAGRLSALSRKSASGSVAPAPLASVNSDDMKTAAESGWHKYYLAKKYAALAAKDYSLAEHYETLGMGRMETAGIVMPKVGSRISKSGRELVDEAGIRMTEHDLMDARGCTAYGDGMGSVRILVRKALELIEGQGGPKKRLLGFLLIGFFTPTWRFIHQREGRGGGSRVRRWACRACFRHSKEGTSYCKEHSKTIRKSKWKSYHRQLHKKFSASLNCDGEAKNAFHHETDTYLRVLVIARRREWMRDIGLYQPQPPKDWKDRVTIWCNAYLWLPARIAHENTWSNVTIALRNELRDVYCHSEDFDLWEAKIHAMGAELEAIKELPSIDNRYQKLPPHEVAKLLEEEPGIHQREIAERLGVSESTISRCFSDHHELQKLRKRLRTDDKMRCVMCVDDAGLQKLRGRLEWLGETVDMGDTRLIDDMAQPDKTQENLTPRPNKGKKAVRLTIPMSLVERFQEHRNCEGQCDENHSTPSIIQEVISAALIALENLDDEQLHQVLSDFPDSLEDDD